MFCVSSRLFYLTRVFPFYSTVQICSITYFAPDVKHAPYVKCSDESNSRRSFVACDVSTGRNECWLRGGVHVSPSPSTGEEPRHRGTLERAFVLVDSPPLARSCHPLITSGSSLAFLSLSVYPHGPYGERRRVQDCAGGDQSIPFTSSVLPPQGHSLPSPPPAHPPHSSRSPVR